MCFFSEMGSLSDQPVDPTRTLSWIEESFVVVFVDVNTGIVFLSSEVTLCFFYKTHRQAEKT